MNCARCSAPMHCRAGADLTYYECSQCGDLWFNSGELENLLAHRIRISLPGDAAGAAVPAGDGSPSPTRECPVCGPGVRLVSMGSYASRHVRLWGCPVCFGRCLSRQQASILVREVCGTSLLGAFRKLLRKCGKQNRV